MNTMEGITPSNITFVLGLLGVLFTVFNYFRNPQIDGDKKDALLAQHVQWTNENNEKRFKGMQESIKEAFTLAQNHTHTVEENVKALTATVNAMNLSITKELATLSAIINERIK